MSAAFQPRSGGTIILPRVPPLCNGSIAEALVKPKGSWLLGKVRVMALPEAEEKGFVFAAAAGYIMHVQQR